MLHCLSLRWPAALKNSSVVIVWNCIKWKVLLIYFFKSFFKDFFCHVKGKASKLFWKPFERIKRCKAKALKSFMGTKVLDVLWKISKVIEFRVKLWIFPIVGFSRSSRGTWLSVRRLFTVIGCSFVRIR